MALNYTRMTTPVEHDEIYAKLQRYSFKIGEMVQKARKFQIECRSDVNTAIVFASEARQLGKKIDAVRKEIIEPARKFIASINDTSKSFTEKLDEIEECMLKKIDQWKDLQKDKQEVYELLEADVVLEKTDVMRAGSATVYEKTEYKFEVVDIEKVLPIYLKVDEKQVELMMKAGVLKIPGLRVWKETKTILRTS